MTRDGSFEMPSDFSRWNHAIGIGDESARQETRWAGVSAAALSADHNDIEALVRLAFQSRQVPIAASVEKFRQSFKNVDVDFEMHVNDRELQVLAAATLATLMTAGGTAGAKAALTVTTASLDGARKPSLPMDLASIGESAIEIIGATSRERSNITPQIAHDADAEIDAGAAAAKATAEFNASGISQAFGLLAESISTTIREIVGEQNEAINKLGDLLRVQDEELQMLWWLVGQRSLDFNCKFDDVPTITQPLIYAKELAELTVQPPGPVSLKAILSRAAILDKAKVSVSAAINSADDSWLRSFMPETEVSPVSTPLHFGIKRKIESGAGSSWIANWAAVLAIDEGCSMTPLTLGVLFYRERLMLRFSGA
jgi:hypothetical protein